jgi:hypothetical protein
MASLIQDKKENKTAEASEPAGEDSDEGSSGIRATESSKKGPKRPAKENDSSRVSKEVQVKKNRLKIAGKEKTKIVAALENLCEIVPVLGFHVWVGEIKIYLQNPSNVGVRIVFDNGHRDTHAIVYNGQVRSFMRDHGDETLSDFMATYAG